MIFMKSEFEFIETLRRRYNLSKIGDDAAVLPKDSKTDLVITADLLVEDIDFRLTWTTPEFIGHKALAVSLSDVAAMGANPVWAMLSVGIPEKIWRTDFVERFYKGWFKAAEKYNVELVGGDISKTPDKIVIDSIAAGETRKGKAILRSNAKKGDLIFVTGNLGGAAAGLSLLEKGIRHDSAKRGQKNLLIKQLAPTPQVFVGQFLGDNKIASAMIDLSDGLSSDLEHLCRASKVGAKIFADKIPFHKNLCSITESFDEKLNFALHGGEDFELLFTVSPKKNLQFRDKLKKSAFACIGEITANFETIELISDTNSTVLQAKGFRHF